MIGPIITRFTISLFKIGGAVLVSTLATTVVRDSSQSALKEIAMDIRQIKSTYADRKKLQGA